MREQEPAMTTDRATEGQMLALLELPAAPMSLDERIMAAARKRCADVTGSDFEDTDAEPQGVDAEGQGRQKLGRVIRLPLLTRAAAAAIVILAAGISLSAFEPGAVPLEVDPRRVQALANGAMVVAAEGAYGAEALPKNAGASVESGEPLAVRPGGFIELALPCGTKLVLDGGSRAELRFDRRERRVVLSRGRIYADVIKVGSTAEGRPIVVESPGGQTRVIGTELMVRAAGTRSEVTVRHGEVRLENAYGLSSVGAKQTGLLSEGSAPSRRRLSSVDRVFRWIGKIQQGARHSSEKPFGGVVTEGEPAIGSLVATLGDGRRLPLKLVTQDVECVVQDGLAVSTVKLAFRNPTSETLEGTFRFALPKAASVVHYAVEVAGVLKAGRVVEREAARAIYREQKERLEEPALLEWSQGSAFTAKIFPIEAGKTKRLEITYSEILPERFGVSSLTLPLVSEAALAHPPERLSLVVRLFGPEGRAALRCPSHFLQASRENGGVVLRLEAEGLRPRNDFVLEIARSEAPIVEGRIEPGPEGEPAAVLVRVRPDLSWADEHLARGPLVVVCDGSASQAGTLKEVQLELLEGLFAEARPNSRVFLAHVELEELKGEGLDARISALWRSEVGGASDLAQTFKALGKALPSDAGATLVYLGDGVSTAGARSDAAVAAAFARYLPVAAVRRFVGVAVGADVNRGLLERIARGRDGVALGVRPGDDLNVALDEVVSAVREPVLTQVSARIEIDGVAEVAPRQPRNLRVGEVLDFTARLSGDQREGTLVLSGLLAGRVFEARAPFALERTARVNGLASLWARRRIQDLREDGPAGIDEATDLALHHGLVTPTTSLLVLSDEEYERAHLRRIASQSAALGRLVQASSDALGAGRFDGAERAAQRALRKAGGREVGFALLTKIAGRRAAAEALFEGGLVTQPGAVGEAPVQGTHVARTSLVDGDAWLAGGPLSVGVGLADFPGDDVSLERLRRKALELLPDGSVELKSLYAAGALVPGGSSNPIDEAVLNNLFGDLVEGKDEAGDRPSGGWTLAKGAMVPTDAKVELGFGRAIGRKPQPKTKEVLEIDLPRTRESAEGFSFAPRKAGEKRVAVLGDVVVNGEYAEAVEKPIIILEEEVEVSKDVPKGTDLSKLSNKNLDSNSIQDAYGVGGGAAGSYGYRGKPNRKTSKPAESSPSEKLEKARRNGDETAATGALRTVNSAKALLREAKKSESERTPKSIGAIDSFRSALELDTVTSRREIAEGQVARLAELDSTREGTFTLEGAEVRVGFSLFEPAKPVLSGALPDYELSSGGTAGGTFSFDGELSRELGIRELGIARQLIDDKRAFPSPTLGLRPPATEAQILSLASALDAATADERPMHFEELRKLSDRAPNPQLRLLSLSRLLRYAPDRLDLHEGTGDAQFALGRRAAALRAYSGLVEVDPNDAAARWRFAMALLRIGLRERALIEARACVRQQPDVAKYSLGVAELAVDLGRAGLAERTLRAVLARNFHPDQGDVAAIARERLRSLWTDALGRASDSRVREALRALASGAFGRRAVRIVLKTDRSDALLVVRAPGEEAVSSTVPLTAAGGRLAGRIYSHTGPTAGSWKVEVRGGQGAAKGVVTVISQEGTTQERSQRFGFAVGAGETKAVFESNLPGR